MFSFENNHFHSREILQYIAWRDVCVMTHLGEISQPCCMNAPSEYHKLFDMVKSLVIVVPSSTCHSVGLNLLTKNSTTLTPIYAKRIHIHISYDRGSMKENTLAFFSAVFFIIILMPKLMYGLVKSTTRSRCEEIDIGAIARSTS